MYESNLERFRALDAQVVGVSTDSKFANAAWARQIGGVSFPLLSDFFPHGDVAKKFGVLRAEGMAERSLFVIDKNGIVRYIDVHELREVPDEAVLFEELEKVNAG